MRAAGAVITAIAITGALSAAAGAAETAEWREAVDLLRASRADRTKLVPAVRKLAVLAENLPEDDPRCEQVSSMLYWAKKLMTVQEAEELARVDRGAAGRAEQIVTRRILPSQAARWLRSADDYAARTDDPLLKAIRYFEVADRFAGTPESLAAQKKSLEFMRAAASYVPKGRTQDELQAFLAEVDALLSKLDTRAAERLFTAEAAKPGSRARADVLEAVARVVKVMRDRPAAIVKGARLLAGAKVRLRTNTGTVTGTLREAAAHKLVIATSYTLNGQKRERLVSIKWPSLSLEQEDEFAARGGLESEMADLAVVRTYVALAGDDANAAEAALGAAGGHPLAPHLTLRLDKVRAAAAGDAPGVSGEDTPATRLHRSLRKGLVLYYPFDKDEGGEVTDMSGEGNHGEVRGATWVGRGKVDSGNGAYRFDGTSSITVACPLEIGKRDVTWALWAKHERASGWQYMLSNKTNYTNSFLRLGLHRDTSRIRVYSEEHDDRHNMFVSRVALDNQWHHVAVVRKDGQGVLCVDGRPVEKVPMMPGNIGVVSEWAIGNDIAGSHAGFRGSLDDVMVWDRALSKQEIKRLYDAQTIAGPFPAPIQLGAAGSRVSAATTVGHRLQVWRVLPPHNEAGRYEVAIEHAASGGAGAFHFVAWADTDGDGWPDALISRSRLMVATKGAWSRWTFKTDQTSVYVGNCWASPATVIWYQSKPPEGWLGLDHEIIYSRDNPDGPPNKRASPRYTNIRVRASAQ